MGTPGAVRKFRDGLPVPDKKILTDNARIPMSDIKFVVLADYVRLLRAHPDCPRLFDLTDASMDLYLKLVHDNPDQSSWNDEEQEVERKFLELTRDDDERIAKLAAILPAGKWRTLWRTLVLTCLSVMFPPVFLCVPVSSVLPRCSPV
jgi:hypothetical protein